MQGINNVSKVQQGKQRRHRRNSEPEPGSYSCELCGSERYHLVLTAQALNNRVGLILRCGNCNTSQEIHGVGTALSHPTLAANIEHFLKN